MTGLAGLIAGPKRRPGLRDEWRSHLAGETGELSGWRRARAAVGFVLAALKLRLSDAAELAWKPVDAVLRSRALSNLFAIVPTVTVALIIYLDAGTLGVLEGMASMTGTWVALVPRSGAAGGGAT
jgi:hypothetical protein